MRASGDAIVAGVESHLTPWLERRTVRVLDAWEPDWRTSRTGLTDAVTAACAEATRRTVGTLHALLDAPPEGQDATPLQIVRGATREPTTVLADAGVPSVVRDEFEERTFPEDRYDLAPRTLDELGTDDLGPHHLAWGLAKAALLRDAAPRAPDGGGG